MERKEVEWNLRHGTVWRPTWDGLPVDMEETNIDMPMDWAIMTKQEAVESAAALLKYFARTGKTWMIEKVEFLTILTGERLTLEQMAKRIEGVK